MPEEEPLPQSKQQRAWVHRQIASLAAFCVVSLEGLPDGEDPDEFATMLATFQTNAQYMSGQGIAEWQRITEHLLTGIREGLQHHASNSEYGAEPWPRSQLYHAITMSVWDIDQRLKHDPE